MSVLSVVTYPKVAAFRVKVRSNDFVADSHSSPDDTIALPSLFTLDRYISKRTYTTDWSNAILCMGSVGRPLDARM